MGYEVSGIIVGIILIAMSLVNHQNSVEGIIILCIGALSLIVSSAFFVRDTIRLKKKEKEEKLKNQQQNDPNR